MSRRRLILGALVAGVLALAPVALAGGEGSKPGGRFALGFNLQFTGPNTTAGTFVVSGALRDAGSSTVEDLAVEPFGRRDRGRLSGIQRFVGARGTIVTRFQGIARDISDPHQWATGRFEIIDATGDYAGLRGDGRFTVVVDTTTNQLIGTELGRVRRR
jgi:hypothetical protein